MYKTVFSLLQNKAENTGYAERIAVIDGNMELSYRAIMNMSLKVGHYLRNGSNVQKGERIGILLKKRWEEVISIFGISYADCVFVPINNQLVNHQIEYVLSDCNVSVLITSAQLLKSKKVSFEKTVVKEIIYTDTLFDTIVNKNSLLQKILNDSHIDDVSLSSSIRTDLAALLYTSGSTGMPKGVMLTNENIIMGAEIVASYLQLRDDERNLSVLPFSFDYGLNQLMNSFYTGSTIHLFNYLFVKDFVKYINEHNISVLALVPHLWIELLAYLEKHKMKIESLRCMTNSGGSLYEKFVLKFKHYFPNGRLFLMYGLTEAFRSTYLPPEELERRPSSIGKAVPNVDIFVLNEKGKECKPGELGELVHRGAFVTNGYWNDVEKTKKRFKKNPFQKREQAIDEIVVYSGDIVWKDDEGYLYFHGRKDDVIKSYGFRISLHEVEDKALEFKFAQEAIAIGVTDPIAGSVIKLLVIFKDGQEKSKELEDFLRLSLPYYMLPQTIRAVENLPLNNNGKIDRPLVHKMYAGI